MSSSEYDDLFVDEKEARKRVMRIAEPYLRFTQDGEILYQDDYEKLTGKQKVLLHIVAARILHEQGLRDEEGIKAGEIAENIQKSKSSVEGHIYGSLKGIVESDNGKLRIPNSALNRVQKEVNGDE